MQSYDLHAKIQNARRESTSFTCPLCTETFTAKRKLWAHAKLVHSSEVASYTSEVEAKDKLLRRAQSKADIILNKATGQSTHRRPPSDQHEYTDTSATDGDPSRPLVQESPASEGRHILERGSGHTKVSPLAHQDPALSSRKRAVEDGYDEPGFSGGRYEPGNTRSRSCHTHTIPANAQDSGFGRQERPRCPDSERHTSGQKKELWGPQTALNASKDSPRAEDRQHPVTSNHWYPVKDLHSSPVAPKEHGRVDRLSESRTGRMDTDTQQPYTSPHPLVLAHGRRTPSNDSVPVDELDLRPRILLQPETRPISHEQLVIEVKGIYAGLVMVEAKCIDIDERQSAAAQEKDPVKRIHLKNDQWQSLIALHKQLLHEHHDFFLASQHPSASPALSRLAAKYSMPARMWRHGIHAFLEVLRYRLPESLEHMIAFIYIAYTMMALLYETVPAFEDTWIECLGDLGRYRMAIEDDDQKDREIWCSVAQLWYTKAADKSPNVGRLCHHRAILALPFSLEQLSLYLRALVSVIPFESARGSVMTLFNPTLRSREIGRRRASSFETAFIRVHGDLFTGQFPDSMEQINPALNDFEHGGLLDEYITKVTSKFKETGVHAAISNIAALFEYSTPKEPAARSRLRHGFECAQKLKTPVTKRFLANSIDSANHLPSTDVSKPEAEEASPPASESTRLFIAASSRLASITLDVSLKRIKDRNVYPLVHVYLVFIWSLIIAQEAWARFEDDVVWKIIERDMPWSAICRFLNVIADEVQLAAEKVRSAQFPWPDNEYSRPLIEDYLMRGQWFVQWMLPDSWFTANFVDIDERKHDPPSMTQPRMERMLWLGHRIASARRWIFYDVQAETFATTNFVNDELNTTVLDEPTNFEQDSIMSDNEAAFFTPERTSTNTSESHDSDFQYTPQSTSLSPSDTDDAETSSIDSTVDLATSTIPAGSSQTKTTSLDKVTEDTIMVDLNPTNPMSSRAVAKLQERQDFSKPGSLSHDCPEYDDGEDAETYKP